MTTRYTFLDVYRGLIVLLMIEGHVVRELLSPALQQSPVFSLHEFVHGITGAGFLFGAGITFGISVQRRWPEFLSVTPTLLRRLRRIALLILTGYALHLPYLSLRKTLEESNPQEWALFLSFDVLQCIGFSLLAVQILMIVLRQERWFVAALFVLVPSAFLISPVVWNVAPNLILPEGVWMALHGKSGSVYPLLPYSAFLFAGGLASYEFMKFAGLGRERVFVKRLATGGVVLILLGIGLELSPVIVYEARDFWDTGPTFMLMKLGGLFLFMSVSWLLENRLHSSPRWIALIGTESLFVYVLHLLLLYGSVVNADIHLSAIWKNSLEWGPALGVSAVFTLLLYALARFWSGLKRGHPVLLRSLVWWMVVVFGFEFFIRPY
ncbi:MAG TPA: heparan-alpha-glucosaminide N-acetyltransferase domain-containing protein [Bacteroidota bacterium]